MPLNDGNTVAEAVKIVTDAIITDPDLYMAYQANIAMSFYDSYFQKVDNGRIVTREEIHLIANDAAKRFIDLWCRQ